MVCGIFMTKLGHNQEDRNINSNSPGNLKSHTVKVIISSNNKRVRHGGNECMLHFDSKTSKKETLGRLGRRKTIILKWTVGKQVVKMRSGLN